MTALAWIGAGLFLAGALALMVRAIRAQAESRDELSAALWAYGTAVPGAIVMTIAVMGFSPLLLAMPGAAYCSFLVITRGQPLLLLGYFIDRIDRKESDRYVARLMGVLLVAVLLTVIVTTVVSSS